MVFGYGFIDIIIKKSALIKAQIDEIIKNYKVAEGHFDSNLIVIRAGMSDNDVNLTAKELKNSFNLSLNNDFVFIKQLNLIEPCKWLKVCKLKKDLQIANKKFTKGFPYFELIAD